MSPALKAGERVLVLRYLPTKFLRKSQIIVLDLSKAESIPAPKPTVVIKRLTGLPGDILRLPASEVDEDVIFAAISTLRGNAYYEFQVPSAHCFVMADGHGSDSRHWGPIPLQALVGVVIKRMSKPDMREHEK